MLLKLNIVCAFDSVLWAFHVDTLVHLGFGHCFIAIFWSTRQKKKCLLYRFWYAVGADFLPPKEEKLFFVYMVFFCFAAGDALTTLSSTLA